jgi:cell division protein FtsL
MIVRVLNFFFVALAALSCLALYRVSENTRVARVELSAVNRQIAQEKVTMNVLQAEWQRVAEPARIQRLAQSQLGMSDNPMVEMSSFEALPRRGEGIDNNTVQNASMMSSSSAASGASVHLIAASGN